MMNEKQQLIAKMIQMQKKFIDKQRESGIEPHEYYLPDAGDELSGYHEAFEKMSARVIDLAHQEQKTTR